MRKIRVLGQETVTGMNRTGAADFCGGDDRLDPQIGLRRQRFSNPHRLIGFADMTSR